MKRVGQKVVLMAPRECWFCRGCGYSWFPRKEGVRPERCPACRSRKRMVKRGIAAVEPADAEPDVPDLLKEAADGSVSATEASLRPD